MKCVNLTGFRRKLCSRILDNYLWVHVGDLSHKKLKVTDPLFKSQCNQLVAKCYIGHRKWTGSLNRPRQWKKDMRF